MSLNISYSDQTAITAVHIVVFNYFTTLVIKPHLNWTTPEVDYLCEVYCAGMVRLR